MFPVWSGTTDCTYWTVYSCCLKFLFVFLFISFFLYYEHVSSIILNSHLRRWKMSALCLNSIALYGHYCVACSVFMYYLATACAFIFSSSFIKIFSSFLFSSNFMNANEGVCVTSWVLVYLIFILNNFLCFFLFICSETMELLQFFLFVAITFSFSLY